MKRGQVFLAALRPDGTKGPVDLFDLSELSFRAFFVDQVNVLLDQRGRRYGMRPENVPGDEYQLRHRQVPDDDFGDYVPPKAPPDPLAADRRRKEEDERRRQEKAQEKAPEKTVAK